MAYTKYSLTPADNNAAPPNGAPEGMLPSAVNDTMRDMMAQIRDVGDGIRGGTYTMTAPVITGGSITGVALSGNTFTNPVITGGAISTSTLTGNTFTNPVISGGSINNTPIGATTANTGKFTTLEATGVATMSAGTVSAPAITTTGDTNTGIFFPAADTIAFSEGGTESARFDSAGNLGIGTTNPSSRLHVTASGTAGSATTVAQLYAGSTAGLLVDVTPQTSGTSTVNLYANTGGDFVTSSALVFDTRNAGTRAERMRITSDGDLLVGTTSVPSVSGVSGNNFNVSNTANNGAWSVFQSTGATSNRGIAISYTNASPNNAFNEFIFCRDSTGTRFAVKSNGGIDNFSANNTNLSDERTKKDISNAGNYLDKICAIPVRTFLYKDQTDTDLNLGVIAQEVEKVAPELISNEGFGEIKEGETPLKAIYQTDLQYALMKSIQELKAELDTVKAELATLKAQP
jgi:hypothetical protein